MLNNYRSPLQALRDSSAISFLLQKFHFIPRQLLELFAQAERGRLYTGILHDLSNPITSLMLYLQSQPPTPHHEVIETVAAEIKHVLQTARSTSHTDARGVVSVTEAIQHAQGLLAYKAMQQGVRIVTYTEHNLFLYGKKLSLQQIITNLLSNAIDAYAACSNMQKDATVTITATTTQSSMQLTVHDFGCGIRPDKIKRIFVPFYTTKTTGTGIGLTLVQQLVKREFGGTLNVVSSPVTGTYFIVCIPRTKNFHQS